jgi:hypothetical protein
MFRRFRVLAASAAVLGLLLTGGSAFSAPKDPKDKAQGEGKAGHGKQHKDMSGKSMVGDKIKQDGQHKFHENGKDTAFVNVSHGKIAGVNVKHSEKGDIPVTKYKTTKKMAQGPVSGIQLAAYDQYIGTMWIGYGYIDDYGDEVIYWFPYDMILDGDTGAIDYYPAY